MNRPGSQVEVKPEDNKETPEAQCPTAEEPTPEASAGAVAPAEAMAALVAERDRLAQEKAALYDQLLRKQADFENLRKRVEREKKEFHLDASMDLVKAVLPVLDGLERALDAPAEGDAGREFRKGIELLQKQFLETLLKLGLEPIAACGKRFDPQIHHAVEVVESEEHEDHSVLEECQRGYRFQHRLLRPAMVRVAVRPEKK